MADIDLKTLTPDTSLPTTGFLFGADSQATANPSVYGVTTAITTILGNAASSDALVFNSDTTFSRGAIRNFRFGAADASPALAQTLSVQSVVAGTSNTAGAAFTVTGSQGTGTGAGGSIIFQVAPAGGSGTAQNTLVDALTINSSKQAIFGVGTVSLPSVVVGANNLGFYEPFGGQLGISLGGAFKYLFGGTALTLPSTTTLNWSSTTNPGDTASSTIARDVAGILAQKLTTNAQEFRDYETTTGPIYKAILGNRQLIKISGAAFDNGAGASAGTMTNAPTAGNPTKWIPIDDNGTTRYIPAW
jgi:hypothetical protein